MKRPIFYKIAGECFGGFLLGWGVDYFSHGEGIGTQTVGIVEKPDLTVELIPVHIIEFISKED